MPYDENPYDDVTLDEALQQLYERFNDRTIRQAIFVMKDYIGGGSGGTSNYNLLLNKPAIDGVELNKNSTADELGLSKKAVLDAYYTIVAADAKFATIATVTGLTTHIANLEDVVSELKEDLSKISTSEIISIPHTRQQGYIIKDNGVITSASAHYYVSDKIDISSYNKLLITGSANYSNKIYAFYDDNEAFISGKSSVNGEPKTIIEDEEVPVPTGAKYLRISMAYNAAPFMDCKAFSLIPKGIDDLSDRIDTIETDVKDLSDNLNTLTTSESYDIIINFVTTWYSGYINKSGSSGSGNYVHTEKIAVQEGDVVWGTSDISGGTVVHRFICAYNGDSAVSSAGGEYVNIYTVPQGIDGIVFTFGSTSTSPLITYHIKRNTSEIVLKPVNANDILFGKKWAVLGDSFSYGGYSPMNLFESGRYTGSRKVYPYYIGNRTHINIVDFTLGGRTLAYPADGSFSNSLTNPNAECYYQNIPSDIDYITIYIGINDSHHATGSSGSDGEDTTGVIPIGTVNDTTTSTFGGAWNVVLSWLMTNRPNAHIGIIVSNGVDNVSYRELTLAIAKKYGIPYIDLNGDERTPAMIRTVNPDIDASVKNILIEKWAVEPNVNNHPNDEAHEFESFIIENFLRSI